MKPTLVHQRTLLLGLLAAAIRTNSAMQRPFTRTLLLLLLTAWLLCSPVARAEQTTPTAPAITIAPTVGPPTTKMLVSGAAFDAYVAVDIYFDKTDLAVATTNGKGAFGGIPVMVPASAVPGTHWITAREHSGKAAQKPFLVRTDWAQFRFDSRRLGMNPYENVLSPDTVGSMGLHWRYQTSDWIVSQPAVAGGAVYVGSIYNFYALNASTGALLWEHANLVSVYSSPAVVNGVLYVGSQDYNLYALNANTGALLWKYTTGNWVRGAPALANGVVYVGSWDNNVYALNAKTGALLWKYNTDAIVDASPAVADGVVYVGSYNGNLYALNANTGDLRWQYTTGAGIYSPAVVANGIVYVGPQENNLYALNAKTGTVRWLYNTGNTIGTAPAVANGVVYVASSSTLYALNASTGVFLWQYTGLEDFVTSPPTVANGVVYVGDYWGNFCALNANTGAPLWKYHIFPIFFASPAIANGVVYIGSSDYYLYTFDLTGHLLSEAFSPSPRPDPRLLSPDWSLEPSTPATRMPSN